MIEDRYRPQAQRAADLYYTLLGAVEDCGADPELTALVVRLSEDHRKIRAKGAHNDQRPAPDQGSQSDSKADK